MIVRDFLGPGLCNYLFVFYFLVFVVIIAQEDKQMSTTPTSVRLTPETDERLS